MLTWGQYRYNKWPNRRYTNVAKYIAIFPKDIATKQIGQNVYEPVYKNIKHIIMPICNKHNTLMTYNVYRCQVLT